jgi:outer membrane biosynthesis protein TonB
MKKGKRKSREPAVLRACGHISLHLAAMEALRKWVYRPATVDRKPVRVVLTVTVTLDSKY